MIVCSGLQEKVWTRWPESLWARIQTHSVAPSSTSSIASTGFHSLSTSTSMWSYPHPSVSTASSMGLRSSTSAHMTWWQPSWGIADIPRDNVVDYDVVDDINDFDDHDVDQAGGVLQVAGEAQHAAAPWLGQIQAQSWEEEQLHPSALNNSTNSVVHMISRLWYSVPIICLQTTINASKWRENHNLVYKIYFTLF